MNTKYNAGLLQRQRPPEPRRECLAPQLTGCKVSITRRGMPFHAIGVFCHPGFHIEYSTDSFP